MYFSTLLVAALIGQAVALPPAYGILEKRDVCMADSLLQSFREPRFSSSASSFCNSYTKSAAPYLMNDQLLTPVGDSNDFTALLSHAPTSLSSACSCLVTPNAYVPPLKARAPAPITAAYIPPIYRRANITATTNTTTTTTTSSSSSSP